MARCTATTKDGQPCKGGQLRGTEFCLTHQPEHQPAVGRDMLKEKTPRGAEAAPPPAVDPVLVGGAMQQMLLRQEIQDRLKRSKGRQKVRDADGYELPEPAKSVPFRVIPRRRQMDSTQAVDRDGKVPQQLRQDWIPRWVRQRDHMDRPTQARVAEFEEYGFEVVYDDAGQKVESRFGVLMQGPPEQYALRASEKTPQGAIQRDDALMLAMDMAEAANRMADGEVARVVVSDEHRTERTLEGSGIEPLER